MRSSGFICELVDMLKSACIYVQQNVNMPVCSRYVYHVHNLSMLGYIC